MMRPSPHALALLALLVAVPAAARADTVFQPGGGKIIGEIVKEQEDLVEIRVKGGGVLRIPREEIDRIERGPVPAEPERPKPAPKPVPPAEKPPPTERPKPASPPKEATEKLVDGATRSPEPEARSPRTSRGVPSFGIDEEALLKPRTRAILDWFERHKADLRAKLAPVVKARRREALELIMDPKRYPDANHGAAAQPEVDRLVDLLRRAWEDPFAEAYDAAPELRRLMAELEEVTEETDDVRARVNKAIAFRDAAPPDDRLAEEGRAVLALNARGKTTADAEERSCVEATNRYRLMFGLRALRLDERLVQAARKHSKNMVELHFFDHTSPVAGAETPDKRVAAEGASYSSENIAMGASEGVMAFHMWYTSSGHHRNLLGDHLTLGVGRYETHWTQDFGRDTLKQTN